MPLHAPKQLTFTKVGTEHTAWLGSEIVTESMAAQLFASVTVTVYVPAVRPVAVALVPPDGAHEYVNGPVPPVIVTVADPFPPPLHDTLVTDPMEGVPPAALETVTDAVAVQPFASVTVTTYGLAARPVAVEAVCTGVVFHA